ncbi:MAG: cupin domain-containing protein [Bacteroidia bacterium]|jgi:mannose-6-phosphate isomerase-like protein (cupin superfamily)|nr:cupin domain-containing protein [Bacteroidia bacterium]
MKKLKRIMLGFLLLLVFWFGLVGILMNHIFPPDPSQAIAALKPGSVIESAQEGISQTVLQENNGMLFIHIALKPHAPGPPEHIHFTFDETFVVKEGTLSMQLAGSKKTFGPGSIVTVPAGTPHRIYNETNATVVLHDTTLLHATMPEGFAAGLACLYPVMDKAGNPKSGKVLLQIAAQGNSFDTWVADAPPGAQKTIRWLLGPTARMLGYGY